MDDYEVGMYYYQLADEKILEAMKYYVEAQHYFMMALRNGNEKAKEKVDIIYDILNFEW